MTNEKDILSFDDVRPNLKVEDSEGNRGTIANVEHDLHNVEVLYLNSGRGLYCLDENCEEYDPLYICV